MMASGLPCIALVVSIGKTNHKEEYKLDGIRPFIFILVAIASLNAALIIYALTGIDR